jgi:hypothetical protein
LQKKFEKDGFPSIAELACKMDWAPLQNLCRRRVVKEKEANEKYQNKTAVEWAKHYGEHGLAKELEYLLVRYACRGMTRLASSHFYEEDNIPLNIKSPTIVPSFVIAFYSEYKRRIPCLCRTTQASAGEE